MKKKTITIHDVAREAGVTHTTVSLVINGNKRISEATREKVQKIIQRLDYKPNTLARRLAGGKTDTIAVVASFFSSFFEMEIMRGIEEVLESSDFNLNQFATRSRPDYLEQLFEQILRENRAEGVIALNIKPSTETLEAYKRAGIPVVLIELVDPLTYSIKSDNENGGFTACRYLLDKGYRRIGILCGMRYAPEVGSSALERYEGYAKALRSEGIEPRPEWLFETENYHAANGSRTMDRIHSQKIDIDALFCAAGDGVAFGLLRRAKELGVHVPDDLAVIGFDDHFASELMSPALTTVKQPIFEMGKQAIQTVLQHIEKDGEGIAPLTVFQPQLIVRESA